MGHVYQQAGLALSNVWTKFHDQAKRLNSGIFVRPTDANAIFKPSIQDKPGELFFEIQPVILQLPERATNPGKQIYVCVEGRIAFSRELYLADGSFVTESFGTHVGYFRKKSDALHHVFGAHFDYDSNSVAHPIFHMQMNSFAKFEELLVERFKFPKGNLDDKMRDVMRTVRVPCAQMDFFSVMLQLCADHLMHVKSDALDQKKFAELAKILKFYRCTNAIEQRLTQPKGQEFFGANAWYAFA